MSTRTRIVLTVDGAVLFGPSAVRQLISTATRRGFMRLGAMPPNWNKMSKRDRMMRLGEYLGPNDTLQLFQEPKGTRKNKSLYWQAIWNRQRPKVKPRPVQAAQAAIPAINAYQRAREAQRQAQLDAQAQHIWRQGVENVAVVRDEPPLFRAFDGDGNEIL